MPVKLIKASGTAHRGLRSTYTLEFPTTKRAIRVWSYGPHLERITTNAESKGIPCIATWDADGTEKWRCHC